MSNIDKLVQAFSEGLGIDKEMVTDDLMYDTIPQWDSVAHMALMTVLENAFDIMLDTDDIIDMSSVKKAKEILGKHGVAFAS